MTQPKSGRLRVYVAGPYTNGDPVVNTKRVIEAGDALLAAGHAPFLPHLNLLWHLHSPKPAEAWYALDLVWLAQADVVLVLDGPASVGVDGEIAEAFRLGIPVLQQRVHFETLSGALLCLNRLAAPERICLACLGVRTLPSGTYTPDHAIRLVGPGEGCEAKEHARWEPGRTSK